MHNAARQGARAAVSTSSSNAEVEAAVKQSVNNSLGLDSDAVTVRISRLTDAGEEQYQVMNLSENEQGEAIRVTVSVDYGGIGLASNILALRSGQLSSHAVMQRRN